MGLIVPHTIVRKRSRSRSLPAQEGKKENKIIESRNKLLLPQRLIQNVFNNPRIINSPPKKKIKSGRGGGLGFSPIWPIRGRTAGYGLVFYPSLCPEQGSDSVQVRFWICPRQGMVAIVRLRI